MAVIGNANVSTVQDTFARKEKKYVLSQEQYRAFTANLSGMLEEEPFGSSLVSSLYYDTPHFDLINRSMEKPLYKEKLRVRSYGSFDPEAGVFVELKKKFKGIVYKRRVQTSWQAAQAIMAGQPYADAVARWPLANKTIKQNAVKEAQVGAEIESAIARHPGLQPAMMVVVNRLPLHTTDGSNVRITFDFEARYRTDRLDFSEGEEGLPIMADGQVIMEIKAQGAYPLWLVSALEEIGAYPQGCSKYGRAYEVAHPDVDAARLSLPVARPSFAHAAAASASTTAPSAAPLEAGAARHAQGGFVSVQDGALVGRRALARLFGHSALRRSA